MSTYVLIQRLSVPSNTNALEFNTLPTIYDDLVIRISDRRVSSISLRMAYNGSTGTSQYFTKGMLGSGISGTPGSFYENGNFSTLYGGTSVISSQTAGQMGYLEYYISDFRATNKHKMSITNSLRFSNQVNGDLVLYMNVQKRNNNEAITSIRLTEEGGGSFEAGASVSLYGISNSV